MSLSVGNVSRSRTSTGATIAVPSPDIVKPPLSAKLQVFEPPSSTIPRGWQPYVHPQGWLYFVNKALKIVTEHDIRDPGIASKIAIHASEYTEGALDDMMEVQLHDSFNLVVNHRHCVASYQLEDVRDDVVDEFNFHQLNRQRRLYWNFLMRFPSHIERCPERAVQEASDALTWFYTDNLISGRSSDVPFSKEECEELRASLLEVSSRESVAKVHFVSWLLREICSFRNAEDYGLHTERDFKRLKQERKQSAKVSSHEVSPAMFPLLSILITVLFFGLPRSYLLHIKRSFAYRGRLNDMQQTWEAYITRLVREYSHFLLISTVLLSATVSFLAVPGVSRGSQMASIISVFASLGSIVLGVFSIWRHQGSTKQTDSYAYMRNARHSWLGLYGHAMLLSLPAALLVWAVIAFMVSIIVYTLGDITDENDLVRASSWISLAIFVVVMVTVGLAVHSLSLMWTFQPTESGLRSHFRSFVTRLKGFRRSRKHTIDTLPT